MISRSLLGATFAVMAISPAIGGGIDSREFLYTSLSGGVPVGLFEDRSSIRIKDLAVGAQDCSTDTVVCFEAEGVFVAIPFRSEGYTSDGTKVSMVEKADMNFFGVRTQVLAFEAARNSSKYRFLYSYDRGLVAFLIVRGGETATYVLGHAKGFRPVVRSGSETEKPKD